MGATVGGIVRTSEAPRSAAAIGAALRDAREYTLGLYAHLSERQQEFPRIDTVNPPRWEVGHIGWFQEFWCRRYAPDDPAGARTPSRLPGADEWFDSRTVPHAIRWELPIPGWDGIRAFLRDTLDDTLSALAGTRDGERYFYELALYHEDMHGEALVMTLQSLALPAPSNLRPPRAQAAEQGDHEVDATVLLQGAALSDSAHRFVFDNEKLAHEVRLAPFAIAKRCVSEGEFAAFADDRGYDRPALWSAEGRAWLAGSGRRMPAYWRRASEGFEVRAFDRWRALDADRPVANVNAFEAEAWCAWAGRRLPSESEWEAAALNGMSTTGGVWEWTATPFAPYPGFRADPYEEYSRPWFHDHRVLRGGSWATARRLVHPRFRNFYRPERHDPFAGFRSCARG